MSVVEGYIDDHIRAVHLQQNQKRPSNQPPDDDVASHASGPSKEKKPKKHDWSKNGIPTGIKSKKHKMETKSTKRRQKEQQSSSLKEKKWKTRTRQEPCSSTTSVSAPLSSLVQVVKPFKLRLDNTETYKSSVTSEGPTVVRKWVPVSFLFVLYPFFSFRAG